MEYDPDRIHAITAFIKKVLASGVDPAPIAEALLTPMEIESIAQRLSILDALSRGVSQREISDRLGVGIATVTRGSRTLKNHATILGRFFPAEREPADCSADQ